MRLGNGYVELFRNIPLLVQMFLWFFVVPELLPTGIGDCDQADAAALELVPSGGDVPRALHLGARGRAGEGGDPVAAPRPEHGGHGDGPHAWQTYRYVILPQSFRIILPPLTSEFMNVIKNSSVALTIGLMELTGRARAMQEFSFQVFEAYAAATVIYLLTNLVVVIGMRWLERRVRVPGLIAVGGAQAAGH